jgi:twitching motility protein PilJ
MAIDLKVPGWFGGKSEAGGIAPAAPDSNPPTGGREALAGATIMEDLRRATRGADQPGTLPLIGGMPIAQQFKVLGIALVVFFMLAALMTFLSGRLGGQNAAASGAATEMQMLSQRLARGGALTSIGNKEGFKQVKEARDRFRASYDALAKGGNVRGVDVSPSSDSSVQEALAEIGQRWEKVEQNAGTLLANEASVTTLSAAVEAINQGNPNLLELTEQGATLQQQAGASTRDLSYANQLVMLTQRIAKNANTLTAGDEIDPEVSFLLGKDVGTFRDIVNGFVSGSEGLRIAALRDGDAKQTYQQIKQRFADYEARINGILQNMQKLVSAKQAARTINLESEPLLEKTRALADAYAAERSSQTIATGAAILFAFLAFVCLAILAKRFLDDARSRAFGSEQENRRNQEAILRLLNEMGTLADGDLTVKASVTEDVTGAIADSINFTVEELRNVVVGINSSTEQVSKATAETQAISDRLFEASQRQSREIQQASASVPADGQSINEVSLSAAQSAAWRSSRWRRGKRGGRGAEPDLRA